MSEGTISCKRRNVTKDNNGNDGDYKETRANADEDGDGDDDDDNTRRLHCIVSSCVSPKASTNLASRRCARCGTASPQASSNRAKTELACKPSQLKDYRRPAFRYRASDAGHAR